MEFLKSAHTPLIIHPYVRRLSVQMQCSFTQQIKIIATTIFAPMLAIIHNWGKNDTLGI